MKPTNIKDTGFYKEFYILDRDYFYNSFQFRATYYQYLFAESLAKKTGSVIEVTQSQICECMDRDEMREAIELMKEGKRIRIYQ